MILIIGLRARRENNFFTEWYDLCQGKVILKEMQIGCLEGEKIVFISTSECLVELINKISSVPFSGEKMDKRQLRICLVMDAAPLIGIGQKKIEKLFRLVRQHLFFRFNVYVDFFSLMFGAIITPANVQMSHSLTKLVQHTEIGNPLVPPDRYIIDSYINKSLDKLSVETVSKLPLIDISERLSVSDKEIKTFFETWLSWTFSESFKRQTKPFLKNLPGSLEIVLASPDLTSLQRYTVSKEEVLRIIKNLDKKEETKLWKSIFPSVFQEKNLEQLLIPPSIDAFMSFISIF